MNVLPSEVRRDEKEGDTDSNINILLQEQHQQPTTTSTTKKREKSSKSLCGSLY